MAIHSFRGWWSLALLRGLLAVVFGLLAFLWPAITLRALILLVGAYALADGVFAVASALRSRHAEGFWSILLLEGGAGILAGLLAILWPDMTALALIYVLAVWCIITGLIEIAAARALRRYVEGEWLLALTGIVSLCFGLFVALRPGAGALALLWLIGAYALAFGVLLIIFALALRRLERDHLIPAQQPPPQPPVPTRPLKSSETAGASYEEQKVKLR